MADKLRKLEGALNAVELAMEQASKDLGVYDSGGDAVVIMGGKRIQARDPLGVAFGETIQELAPVIETLVRHRMRKMRVVAEADLADACKDVLNGKKAG